MSEARGRGCKLPPCPPDTTSAREVRPPDCQQEWLAEAYTVDKETR